MCYYVNDATCHATLLICKDAKEATVYANWANEHLGLDRVCVKREREAQFKKPDELLGYFGFTVDSLVDAIFLLLPARSRLVGNVALIKALLREPTLTKQQCCLKEKKSPTHYSRLSNSLSLHTKLVSDVTGGRNPMKLLRAIRSDI